MSDPVLCLFARAPVLGGVKRRLAAAIGDEEALAAHCTLVEDTLNRLAHLPGVVTELWLDDAAHPGAAAWARRWRVEVRQQRGGDLGTRMHQALCHGLARAGASLVVGSDCPAIDGDYVARAVAALTDHDVVVGPARDGGYGLVAARRPVPELFRGIAWGTSSVLAESTAAAAAAGYSLARLAEISDVDTVTEWRAYLRSRGPCSE